MTKNVIGKETFEVSPREAKRKARFPQNVDGCLACRELLCNNIVVSCTTNVERRLELSEPWIDGITGLTIHPRQGLNSSRSRVSLHCEWNTFRISYRDIVQFLPRERERERRSGKNEGSLSRWIRGWRSHTPLENSKSGLIGRTDVTTRLVKFFERSFESRKTFFVFEHFLFRKIFAIDL